jgi:hypothetical protein
MKSALLHPTPFPDIASFAAMVKAEKVYFEVKDNYQKQTYRNRYYIYGANGKLALTVPVAYTQKNRQRTEDVVISNTSQWQTIHWKSILSAYKTSPFFEFYEDDLRPLFLCTPKNLLEFNLMCFKAVLDCLQIDISFEQTLAYEKHPKHCADLRSLVDIKNTFDLQFEKYTQVFGAKHGFLNNLSILDLLFNLGPDAPTYLDSQPISFQ